MRDLTGERFGRLTVIALTDERTIENKRFWLCKCDCGEVTYVVSGSLVSGRTKSCGCLVKERGKNIMRDLTGMRFGRLTVLRPTDERAGGGVVWECKCDCGNTKLVASRNLLSGNTKSCGCLSTEAAHRSTLKQSVKDWRKQHPDGTIKECVKDTGFSVSDCPEVVGQLSPPPSSP